MRKFKKDNMNSFFNNEYLLYTHTYFWYSVSTNILGSVYYYTSIASILTLRHVYAFQNFVRGVFSPVHAIQA